MNKRRRQPVEHIPVDCETCKQPIRHDHGITIALMLDSGEMISGTTGSPVCALSWFLEALGFTAAGRRPIMKVAKSIIQKSLSREGQYDHPV